MPTPPLVSILVTVYNREAYLRDTLESILASSFSDFELIVVDDKSTDASVEIAQTVARNDDRVRLAVNARNLGDYGNRMRAASMARGHYLKYVDSDDLIYPHGLQVMVDSMKRYPKAAVGLAHSMPEDDAPYPWELSPEEAYRKHFMGRGCMSCGPTGAILLRQAFESVGGFREDWGVLSDTELWYRLATSRPIVLLAPGLVWWRRHKAQEFTKKGAPEAYLRQGYELDVAALEPGCPLPEAERRRAIRRRKHQFARRVWSMGIKELRPASAARLFLTSDLSVTSLFRGLSPAR